MVIICLHNSSLNYGSDYLRNYKKYSLNNLTNTFFHSKPNTCPFNIEVVPKLVITTLHFITPYMSVVSMNRSITLVTTLHFITPYMPMILPFTKGNLVTTLHFITPYMVKMLCNCVKEL